MSRQTKLTDFNPDDKGVIARLYEDKIILQMKEKRVDLKRLEDAEKEADATEKLDELQKLHHGILVATGVASAQNKMSIDAKSEKLELLKANLQRKVEKQQALIDRAESINAPPELYDALQTEFDMFRSGQSFLDRRFSEQESRTAPLVSEVKLLQSQLKSRDARIAALKGQVESLESETTSHDAKVLALNGQVKSLEAEIESLQGQLETRHAEATKQGRIEHDLRKERDSATQRIATLDDEVSLLKGQLKPLRQDKGRLEHELETQHESNRRIALELSGTRAELLDKQAQLDLLEAAHKEQISLVEEKTRSQSVLETQITQQKQRNNNIQQQLDSKSKELESTTMELAAEKVKLTSQIDHLKQEMDGLRKLSDERSQEMARKLAAETTEKEKLGGKIDEIKHERDSLYKDLEQKRQDITDLTHRLDTETTEKSKLNLQIDQIKQEKENLDAILEQKGQQITSLTGRLDTEAAEKAELKQQNDQIKLEKANLSASLEQKGQEITSLTGLLKTEAAEKAELKQQNDQIKLEKDNLSTQLQEKLDEIVLLNNKHKQVEEGQQKLQLQLTKSDEKVTSLTNIVDADAAKKADLCKQYEQAKNDRDGLQAQSVHKNKEIASLNKQLGSLQQELAKLKLTAAQDASVAKEASKKALQELNVAQQDANGFATTSEHLCYGIAPLIGLSKADVKLRKLDDRGSYDYFSGFVTEALPMLQKLAGEKRRIASEFDKLHKRMAEQLERDRKSVIRDDGKLVTLYKLLDEDDDDER